MDSNEKLREIGSIDKLIRTPLMERLSMRYSRARVVNALRTITDSYRECIRGGKDVPLSDERVAEDVEALIAGENARSLKRVVNATGTVIHTNLGRAPLPDASVEALILAARGPVNLEFDLEKGRRGNRDSHLEKIICRLTGAEAATVVNNNAGALFLVLNTLSKRKDVIVSRGELIEIGGSFRIPEIINASGCKMVETGTTNRTRLEDYNEAISKRTGVLLKVHASNYRVVGFTESVDLKELSSLGKRRGVCVAEDLGSGAFVDLARYGLPREPVVRERIEMGADLVMFSGDKLLGGPQAGIIAGRSELIKKINKNPVKRVLRVDKLTIAALEALLRLYLDEERIHEKIPILRYLTRPLSEIESLAGAVSAKLNDLFGEDALIRVVDGFSEIGSGSLPGETIPTKLITIRHRKFSAGWLAKLFRNGNPPVIGRIQKDLFIMDTRCIEKTDDIAGYIEKKIS